MYHVLLFRDNYSILWVLIFFWLIFVQEYCLSNSSWNWGGWYYTKMVIGIFHLFILHCKFFLGISSFQGELPKWFELLPLYYSSHSQLHLHGLLLVQSKWEEPQPQNLLYSALFLVGAIVTSCLVGTLLDSRFAGGFGIFFTAVAHLLGLLASGSNWNLINFCIISSGIIGNCLIFHKIDWKVELYYKVLSSKWYSFYFSGCI